MPLVQWQGSFSVGVPVIDADHKTLISLLNQMHEARQEGHTREVVGSILNVLVEYTVHHFQREEKLMDMAGYPGAQAHKEMHRKLAAEAKLFQLQYEEGRHAAVDELFEFLKNWLVGHILGVDIQIGVWVEKVELEPGNLLGRFGLWQQADDKDGGPLVTGDVP